MVSRNCYRIYLALVLAIVLSSAMVWAQSSNGSVRGTVQDQTSAVIPNVTVVLVNTATGIENTTVSNNVGIYAFPAVAPGPYKISAESAGMKKYEATLTVQTQQSVDLTIVLAPAGTQTVVSVQDVTPMVKTDTPTLSHSLERTRIEQLPINGRNVVALLNTVPGLQQDTNGAWRVYGTRVGTHDMSLDGAAMTDAVYGGAGLGRMPSLDSIQEFNVVNNASSAKYARQANIIMTTKGGTNELHGTLFETHRNNQIGLARRREDGNTAAKLIRNEFGGTVGGPIWIPKIYNGKNRTFFFFALEAYKERTGPNGFFRVPTEAMRNGDLSGLVYSDGVRPKIYNPYTTDPVTFSREQFNYGGVLNRIDPALQSPLSKYTNSVVPLPNIPGVNPLVADNFTAPRPVLGNQHTWTMRFDHRLTDKDQIYARLGLGERDQFQPAAFGVPMLDQVGNSDSRTWPNKSGTVNWTRSFSPTFFNEFSFSTTRTITTQTTGDMTRKYADELGLPNPAGAVGFPIIFDIGVGSGSSNYFQPNNWRAQFFTYYVLDDNATKIAGKHELQFGVHLRYDQLNYMPQQQRTAGGVGYSVHSTGLYDPTAPENGRGRGALNTGHVAAAHFLGLANYDYQVPKGMYYVTQNEDALYFQDNIRATSRLTLNLGVRWQFSPYPKDKHDVFSGFDMKSMSIVLGRPLEDLYKMGVTSPGLVAELQKNGAKFTTPEGVGLPKRLINNNWFDIGPHVGFAYRALEGRRSFVIRGGFSTNYFPVPIYGWNDRMRLNAPFFGYYQNFEGTDAAQSPDGLRNYNLVSKPTIIAGLNSKNAISLTNPKGLVIGDSSYAAAYFTPDQPSARVHDWNLTLEKEILTDTVVRAGYVGNRATHQDSYQDLNQTIPDYVWYMTTKQPLPTGPRQAALRRPNSTTPYGHLQEYRRDGWGNSNGVTLEFERRYAKGIGFQVFYTMMNPIKAAGHGWYGDSQVSPVSSFLPGAVPTDLQERTKFLLYARDITIPKHEVRWNWVADLPFGKGRLIGRNANRFLDAVIGGWQVTGMGRWSNRYFALDQDNLWPTSNPVEFYGRKYPIQDCRSGTCRASYLMWNGYIPAHQINSVDANGKPNGYMGVPADYKPAVSPVNPYPADFRSRSKATDPMYGYYGSNTTFIPLNNGGTAEVGFGALNPYRNQYVLSTGLWNCDAAMFKNFSITERFKFRLQGDFFNVFNTPGNSPSPGSNGVAQAWQSAQGPRTVQISGRVSW